MHITPTKHNLLESALALAAKGFCVFPVLGKRPRVKAFKSVATTDSRKLTKWWHKWPDANVGISLKGLVAIDIDGVAGNANLFRLGRLPNTARFESGRGKDHYHLIYRLPTGIQLKNKPLAKYSGFELLTSIDIKTYGGFVVGPGSIHSSGKVYTWTNEPCCYTDLPFIPSWLIQCLELGVPGWRCQDLQQTSRTQTAPASVVNVEKKTSHLRREFSERIKLKGKPKSDYHFYLNLCLSRFPITRHGQRHDRMLHAMAHLSNCGLDVELTREILRSWLRIQRNAFSSTVPEAFSELECVLKSTFESGFINHLHRQGRAKLVLPPVELAILKSDFSKQQEFYFAEALLVVARRESTEHFKITDAQIMDLILDRHGIKLHRQQYYRIKARFISMGEKVASRIELATCIQVGERRLASGQATPSIYRLTGLSDILARGSSSGTDKFSRSVHGCDHEEDN